MRRSPSITKKNLIRFLQIWRVEYEVVDVKRGERSKKHRFRLRPVPSAGGIQSTEFCNFKDDAYRTAALWRWILKEAERLVWSLTCVRIRPIFEEADAKRKSLCWKSLRRRVCGRDCIGTEAGKNDVKNIQDAHEAIRPSDVTRVPAEIKESLQETSSVCISWSGSVLWRAECSRQNMRQLLLKLEQMITVLRYRHLRLYLKVSVWHMWKAMRKNRVEM